MEGPTTLIKTRRICGDCIHHRVEKVMFGKDYILSNYICTHPEEMEFLSNNEGRAISWRSTEPETPNWCPFLKDKTKQQ